MENTFSFHSQVSIGSYRGECAFFLEKFDAVKCNDKR